MPTILYKFIYIYIYIYIHIYIYVMPTKYYEKTKKGSKKKHVKGI